MAGRFTLHVTVREPMKFVIDKRHQLIAGNLVTLCPGPEQFRYLVRWFLVLFHGRQSLAGGGTYTFDSCPHARDLRAFTERSIEAIRGIRGFHFPSRVSL
jgi:hypothetical protein